MISVWDDLTPLPSAGHLGLMLGLLHGHDWAQSKGSHQFDQGQSGTLTKGTGLRSLVFWPHAIKSPLMDWAALNKVHRRTPRSILTLKGEGAYLTARIMDLLWPTCSQRRGAHCRERRHKAHQYQDPDARAGVSVQEGRWEWTGWASCH